MSNTSHFYLNLELYSLFAGLLLHIVLFPHGFWRALAAHATGADLLALVPATTLLGSQFVQLRDNDVVGNALWVGAADC